MNEKQEMIDAMKALAIECKVNHDRVDILKVEEKLYALAREYRDKFFPHKTVLIERITFSWGGCWSDPSYPCFLRIKGGKRDNYENLEFIHLVGKGV